MLSLKKSLLGAALLLAPVAVQAANVGTTMAVSGSVVSSCTIAAAPLAFGNYSGAVTDIATTISPNCSNGTPYYIQIDQGAGSGATLAQRKLVNGAATLDYALYTTTGRTVVWGITQGTDTVAGTGSGTTQTVSVFGRIFAGQSSTVGTGYADTVNITLNF